jgi:hypothetical protein
MIYLKFVIRYPLIINVLILIIITNVQNILIRLNEYEQSFLLNIKKNIQLNFFKFWNDEKT